MFKFSTIRASNKDIFKSDRYFTVFDYSVGHSQLLIRSARQNDGEKNIDIIFFDTTFVQSYMSFDGLKIRFGNRKDASYAGVKEYLESNENSFFEIESGGSKYYIAASFMRVYENELGFKETSLGVVYKGRETEIAASI